MKMPWLSRLPGVVLVFLLLVAASVLLSVTQSAIANDSNLAIRSARVTYLKSLDLLVFEQRVRGHIGTTVPTAAGQLDGAPVLGYVFPTTLQPSDVGFDTAKGIVALAVTSHPDFDDTPLWDENNNHNYADDGEVWHTHWVVLVPDERVPGKLSVQQFQTEDNSIILPPTNPGMPMYMDSPGYAVIIKQHRLKVLVPAQRINHKTRFNFDAVTAHMQVNTSDPARPLLGVDQVYSVLSQDLSLPYTVQHQK